MTRRKSAQILAFRYNSEDWLHLAAQESGLGLWFWDEVAQELEWDSKTREMFGVSPTQPVTIQTFLDATHPDDRDRVMQHWRNCLERRLPYTVELRALRPDGTMRWIDGRGNAHYDKQGRTLYMAGVVFDVTDRKRAEEERFRHAALVQSSHDAIISKNLDAVITSWNAAAERMFGYAEADAVGQPINLIIPPELQNEETGILERLRAGDRIEHYETRRLTKTGKRIDVSLLIGPIKDSAGRVVGFSKIAHDITYRKQAQQALHSSEERFRLAQQAARIGTFERDLRTGVVTWTTEVESLYGLPPGAFDKTPIAFFENLIHPEDRERVSTLIQQAIETGRPTNSEWRVVWPDGSIHWIAGSWQVFLDDSRVPSRMIGINVDVSERKQAENALLELNRALDAQAAVLQSREELLRTFVKNVPAGVAMFDRNLHYLQVSDRWCSDYGVEASQILGRSHYELFPDLPERWREINRCALEGETFRADEDQWTRQDGTTFWIRWEVRPWRTPEGAVGGIFILAEDITHRKQMQEALSDMSRKLLESQEQERDRIGRELHDDINQRLAFVAVQVAQLKENPSDLQDRVRQIIEGIMELGRDVQALSHDLHASKLEYLGTVAGMRSWCKEFAQHHKIQIDFSTDVSGPVPLDIGKPLFRILQEALHNAIKHSGVREFAVQLQEHPSEVHLIIHDSGRGFDLDKALQGAGLGLTSMRERVRLIDGTISIESEPNQGTTIQVRVPLPSQQASQRAAV